MTNRNRLLIPEARKALNEFKANVMKKEGFHADQPSDIKYEVAKEIGVPLRQGYNGNLQAKDAGSIGGKIGGTMVKEMVRLAQEQLSKQK